MRFDIADRNPPHCPRHLAASATDDSHQLLMSYENTMYPSELGKVLIQKLAKYKGNVSLFTYHGAEG